VTQEITAQSVRRPRFCVPVLTIVVALLATEPLAAQSPSAEEIIQRQLASFYHEGQDFRAEVLMRLTNARGSKRERVMKMLRVNVGSEGDQRYLIYFDAPADVRGLGFLVWKYPRREDDRWLYFPALKVVKRVAADDKRSSFVGSDFTYEDISGRDLTDEQHTLLRNETINDRAAYVIESRPKAAAIYARRVSWIDSERWLPLKEEYYDAQNTLQRVFQAEKVENIEGHWTVTVRSMTSSSSSHRTDVTFKSVRYDTGLAAEVFTEHSLRNPPASVR
jgi:outer membrane lipoprotein-sorting protein